MTRLKKGLMSGLAAMFVFAANGSAEAQRMPCGTHDGMVTKLTKQFKERQQAIGMVGNKAVVEVFVSAKGSWTILVTGTDGKACVMAAGQSWESIRILAGSEI